MTQKLSFQSIDTLTPRDKPYEVCDTGVGGLRVRIQPTGVKTFIFTFRNADGTPAMPDVVVVQEHPLIYSAPPTAIPAIVAREYQRRTTVVGASSYDGAVFDRDHMHLTLGRFVDEAPYTSDYTWLDAYHRYCHEREDGHAGEPEKHQRGCQGLRVRTAGCCHLARGFRESGHRCRILILDLAGNSCQIAKIGI